MSVRQDKVQVDVEINGQKAGSSIKELENSAKQLRRELKQLPTDSDAFTAKAAELRNVNTQLRTISDSIKGVDNSLKDASTSGNVFTKALSAGLGFFTGGAFVDLIKGAASGVKSFFEESVAQSNDAAKASAQLTQALNGNVEATEKLQDQAGDLQKSLKGLFDDDDIVKAQTRLGLYTKEADEIQKLTPLILDLATAKGVDLETASDAIGKSLSGNGDALKKLGISVKDAGTEQERLRIISDGLTAAVGGQAKVVAESGTTGWQRFANIFDNVKEAIGGRLTPVISALGNFLSDLIERSQPVVDVFSAVFKVVGQVWDQVKQLLASFGLFNDKVSISQVLIDGITTAFTYVGKAIQVVVTFVRDAITVFNELVARGSGTVTAVITAFTSLKDFFINVFSNVGDIIKGVFTLDLDQIRAGVDGLKGTFGQLGTDVRNAYETSYKAVKDKQKAVADKEDDDDTQKQVAKAAARGKKLAQSEADAKAAEKARKEKEALDKDLADLRRQVDNALVNAQPDGQKKEVNQENLRYEQELQDFIKRINDLRKRGVDESKIRAEFYAFDEASLGQHMDKLADINHKYQDKRKADAQKTDEQLKKEKEEYYKNEVDSVNLYYDTLISTIRQNEAKKVAAAGSQEEIDAIKQNAADAELEIERKKNEELLALAQENGKSTIDLANQVADGRIKAAEKTATAKQSLEEQIKKTVKDGLDFAIDALSQDEAARKKNAGLIKAFSVARVFINLQEEISGIFTNANRNALNAIVPGAGNVLGAVQAALAVGRATFAVSKINQQQFYDGGYTGEGMGYKDRSGHQVAGVVHANEWVSPQWMTDHPQYGKVIHQLEYIRQRGFADGGYTTTPTGGIPTFSSTISETTMQRFVAVLEGFPREVKAKVVYSEFESVASDVDDVRKNAAIG